MIEKKNIVLGIDFDNTIVSYDEILYQIALNRGLIDEQTPQKKRLIRDQVRSLASGNGEIEWQRLQAFVYGKGMQGAVLIDGVKEFLKFCQENQIKVFVVSHKTEFASMDEQRVHLQETALKWMKENDFFSDAGLGFSLEQIYFETTREKKIERIQQLQCTHFIDDLVETYLEKSFPSDVTKILYATDDLQESLNGIVLCQSWKDIYEYFFAK